ncbi:hypothetical protein DP116_07895 [Brasilonema bromeliae SPC951]|uniref:Uncharacterized protein n=1 Tax=Brasilonema bromeliae SPC951 TaxID=385972 RepID=A0ABX1P512_9CYAN|nr:hypothetical protein [Brasilonema bromeliae SPC951]
MGLRREPAALVCEQYEPQLIDPSFSKVEPALVIVAILDWVGDLYHGYILELVIFTRFIGHKTINLPTYLLVRACQPNLALCAMTQFKHQFTFVHLGRTPSCSLPLWASS